ncbi:uncharacterized protein N7482_005058 [Penicillium canariense]|uniref:Uncharacterized protein n=1 Tax=Penicillium canariense TaxID=189055 RepID=A0A9W9I794_9EURO|nr:uncharacterized protein N7482_005058 [Penicillium canariense]KAJ5166277.1 hypothetical protein N7482_005058 [Penicillium canariense]
MDKIVLNPDRVALLVASALKQTLSSPGAMNAQFWCDDPWLVASDGNGDVDMLDEYSYWDRTRPGASMTEIDSLPVDGRCGNNPNLNGFAFSWLGASVPITMCQDLFPKWLADFNADTTITAYKSIVQPPTVNVEPLRQLFSVALLHEMTHTRAFLNRQLPV